MLKNFHQHTCHFGVRHWALANSIRLCHTLRIPSFRRANALVFGTTAGFACVMGARSLVRCHDRYWYCIYKVGPNFYSKLLFFLVPFFIITFTKDLDLVWVVKSVVHRASESGGAKSIQSVHRCYILERFKKSEILKGNRKM